MADPLLLLVAGLNDLGQFDVDHWRVVDHYHDTNRRISNTIDSMILGDNEIMRSSVETHAGKGFKILKERLRWTRFWEERERETMERLRYCCHCGRHRIREVDGELFMYIRRNWKHGEETR